MDFNLQNKVSPLRPRGLRHTSRVVAYELVLGPVPPYQHLGLLLLDDYLYLFAQLLSQLPVPSLVVLQIL